MSKKNLNYQLKSNGNVPLDYKETPLKKVAELNDIPLSDRFLGMTVTVLNADDGKPADYWYIGDNLYSAEWKKKTFGEEDGSNHVINGENPKIVDVTKTDELGKKKGELIVASDNVKIGVEDNAKGNTGIVLGETYGKRENALLYSKSSFLGTKESEIATTYNIHLIKQLIGKKLRYNKCSGELIPSHSTLQSGVIRKGDFAYVGVKSRGISSHYYLASYGDVGERFTMYNNYFYFESYVRANTFGNRKIGISKSDYDAMISDIKDSLVDRVVIIEVPYARFNASGSGNNNRFSVDLDRCKLENNNYIFDAPTDWVGSTSWVEEHYGWRVFLKIKNDAYRNCIVLNRDGQIEYTSLPENKWVKVLRHNKKFTIRNGKDIWEPQSLDMVQDFYETYKNHKNRVIEYNDFCKLIANNEIQVWLYSGAKNSRSLYSRRYELRGRPHYCWRQFAKTLDGSPKRNHWPVVEGYALDSDNGRKFYSDELHTKIMPRTPYVSGSGYDGCLFKDKTSNDVFLRKLGTSPENDTYEEWYYSDEFCNTAKGVSQYITAILTRETHKIPRDRFRKRYNGENSTIHNKRYLDFAVFRIMNPSKTYRRREKYYTENMGGIYRLTYNENFGISNCLTYLGPIPYFKNMK